MNPNHSLFLVQALPTFKTWAWHPEMLLLLLYYIWYLSQKLFLPFLQPLCSHNISVLGCDRLHHLTDVAHPAYSWRPPRGRMASVGEGHNKSSKSQAAAAFVPQSSVRTPTVTCFMAISSPMLQVALAEQSYRWWQWLWIWGHCWSTIYWRTKSSSWKMKQPRLLSSFPLLFTSLGSFPWVHCQALWAVQSCSIFMSV